MSIEPLGPHSPANTLSVRAGGKAARLAALEKIGCTVPPWFCIAVEAFDASLAEAVRRAGGSSADAQSAGTLTLRVPSEVASAVRGALSRLELDDAYVAVRSSGLDEDGTEHSFAGQFEACLYRRGADTVLDAIGRCWASAFSERNVAYRRAIGAADTVPRMGVIVQRMVDPDSAGVSFSRNPLDPGDRDGLVVESVWGQGEGIVGGELESDRFVVDRTTLDFVTTIAEKSRAIVRGPNGGTHLVPVEADRSRRPSLTNDQVREVARMSLRPERELGSPQDFEWAFSGGRLYSLQARPITTLPPDSLFDERVAGGNAVIWDNSNIIESYAGVTTPLTFSHVSRAYREVYFQTCRIMGVPDALVHERE